LLRDLVNVSHEALNLAGFPHWMSMGWLLALVRNEPEIPLKSEINLMYDFGGGINYLFEQTQLFFHQRGYWLFQIQPYKTRVCIAFNNPKYARFVKPPYRLNLDSYVPVDFHAVFVKPAGLQYVIRPTYDCTFDDFTILPVLNNTNFWGVNFPAPADPRFHVEQVYGRNFTHFPIDTYPKCNHTRKAPP